MNYKLSKHVRVAFDDIGLSVGFGTQQFHAQIDPKVALKILNFFCEARNDEEVDIFLNTNFPDEGQSFKKILIEKNVLVKGCEENDGRYSRPQLYYHMTGDNPDQAQESLSKSLVVMVGAGGIGNLVSLALVTAGVGRLSLVDNDIIETSNLSRQWAFTEQDVGSPKVIALRRALLDRNSTCDVTCHAVKASEESLPHIIPKDATLVVISADGLGVVSLVSSYCARNRIPYINVGYVNDIAVWGPFYMPGERGCNKCLPLAKKNTADEETNLLISSINRMYQAPSCGPINMLASAFAASDIIAFLTRSHRKPKAIGRRLGISPQDLELREIPVAPEEYRCTCITN